jgi:holo-[acyl-carrier protein] synthase
VIGTVAPPVLAGAIGIGVDTVAITDFAALPFLNNQPFYERMFSPAEIAYCLTQAVAAPHFAARFAAKEATVKAFSSVTPLGYWQVEVVRAAHGAPGLRLWNEDRTGPAAELVGYRPLISLSHTDALATAFVVVYDERGH